MKRRLVLLALTLAFLMGQATWADSGRLALAGRAGTLGLGGDVMVNVLTDLNLRLGVGAFRFDFDAEYSDIDYDFELDMLTFPMTLDWYPFDEKFHISAGVVINDSDATLDSTPGESLQIGDDIYTPTEIGVLSGRLGFDNVAPYIGIGWGNAFGKSRRWGFVTDLGVAFVGSPNVDLSASGTLASDPGFIADLARQEADLEDHLEDFKIYPVFSANLYFRF
ncbi:MAG: hypothetical protein JSW27_19130 [Phycisphaerales bacterium]|nr:MAG: hypothetical protein JSW27_19130 [Phycisphaerales bacterium]